MVGKRGFGQAFSAHSLLKQRVAVVVGFMLGLSLQCYAAHAALVFRSIEHVNGQQRMSPIRNYSNPSDTDSARVAGNGPQEVRVFLSGEVTRADVDSAAVMERLLKSGRQKIAGNTVWLASNGGDIDAGMDLGRRLRKLGVYTVIGKNDQCLSACVFAFMGGERRSVAGRLGIHRPYFPFTENTADRPARFRHLQKTLKAYIEEMDFPDSLYEAVMLVPPESMQTVSPADLRRFYLEGISPSTEDQLDAASARRRNISMFEYLKRKAAAPACAFFDAGEGRCEGKVLEAAAGGGMGSDPLSVVTGEPPAPGRADSVNSGLFSRKPPGVDARDPT